MDMLTRALVIQRLMLVTQKIVLRRLLLLSKQRACLSRRSSRTATLCSHSQITTRTVALSLRESEPALICHEQTYTELMHTDKQVLKIMNRYVMK